MSSFASLTIECHLSMVMASPTGSASLVTSFHFSHFFCFVRSFENDTKRTPFSRFIFCRRVSLFVVTILPLLAFLYLMCHTSRWDDRWQSSKIFHETGFNATCHLSLPHQSTRHLSHPLLHESRPRCNIKCAIHEDACVLMLPVHSVKNEDGKVLTLIKK